jgi:hypothetical protein
VRCRFNIEDRGGDDMAIRNIRGDVKQITARFWSLASAKSKFLS